MKYDLFIKGPTQISQEKNPLEGKSLVNPQGWDSLRWLANNFP